MDSGVGVGEVGLAWLISAGPASIRCLHSDAIYLNTSAQCNLEGEDALGLAFFAWPFPIQSVHEPNAENRPLIV